MEEEVETNGKREVGFCLQPGCRLWIAVDNPM